MSISFDALPGLHVIKPTHGALARMSSPRWALDSGNAPPPSPLRPATISTQSPVRSPSLLPLFPHAAPRVPSLSLVPVFFARRHLTCAPACGCRRPSVTCYGRALFQPAELSPRDAIRRPFDLQPGARPAPARPRVPSASSRPPSSSTCSPWTAPSQIPSST